MMEYTVWAVFLGFLLDLAFGDRSFFMHPIRLIGIMIGKGEEILNKLPLTSDKRKFSAGAALSLLVIGASWYVPFFFISLFDKIHPAAGFVVQTYLCYQIFAAKSLKSESMKVHDALLEKDIMKARKMLSFIVGRDTRDLNEEQIAKAAVETVAENASDGVIAPMLFMMIGGAPLGLMYKGINTLDSMIGYQNEKYQYFGKFAARMDDVANFIPARLTAILMILCCYPCGLNGKEAFRIFQRDRHNHKSPNSGQTESVCAGALGIQLGGPSSYFGQVVKKETIGDESNRVGPEYIGYANKLMISASIMGIVVLCAARGLFLLN